MGRRSHGRATRAADNKRGHTGPERRRDSRPDLAEIRHDLMGDTALVDELVVIDSDSTDDTASVAGRHGAVLHAARSIRRDVGGRRRRRIGEGLLRPPR
jgi:hypothetical protein